MKIIRIIKVKKLTLVKILIKWYQVKKNLELFLLDNKKIFMKLKIVFKQEIEYNFQDKAKKLQFAKNHFISNLFIKINKLLHQFFCKMINH